MGRRGAARAGGPSPADGRLDEPTLARTRQLEDFEHRDDEHYDELRAHEHRIHTPPRGSNVWLQRQADAGVFEVGGAASLYTAALLGVTAWAFGACAFWRSSVLRDDDEGLQQVDDDAA